MLQARQRGSLLHRGREGHHGPCAPRARRHRHDGEPPTGQDISFSLTNWNFNVYIFTNKAATSIGRCLHEWCLDSIYWFIHSLFLISRKLILQKTLLFPTGHGDLPEGRGRAGGGRQEGHQHHHRRRAEGLPTVIYYYIMYYTSTSILCYVMLCYATIVILYVILIYIRLHILL